MKNTLHLNNKALSVNWDKISDNLLNVIWQLFLTTLIFYLISHYGTKLINRYINHSNKPRNKRTQTIKALITSVFQYTIIFFYLGGVLSILGVPVGTLLASAGIFSLALGMGAQGFVSDLVNGFFILSEDQFDVGDTVQINSQIGTVIQLGLRTTRLKGSDGSIIYIPNRNISIVQNLAHGGISVNVAVELDAANDFNQVKEIIKNENKQIQPEKKTLVQGPTIVGITAQTGNNVTFTVHFQVKPGKESTVRDLYLSHYIRALQKNNIKFATIAKPIAAKS
ncbi:mechanosensitive ion channel family protein [Lactobacillus sp. LL6]|uniref:mechanosensitive ion channel family protein n=1 Tax=Lactobacillus sp. LL6 TaxID=2596827 RepID=UPI001186A28F|nr:mechanosensitive ion channel family protein [Lactobacillus sp. LL6]TSO25945.1 mechanosensitive ion channel family protein [Lactobacillus sp. LL6]